MLGRPYAFVSALLLGCAGAPPSPAVRTGAPPAPGTGPVTSKPAPDARIPAPLEKTFTGQARPSLTVTNRFPVAQHVFIDWEHRGLLLPAHSRSFELAAGTHTITCADSEDPDDNPAALTESFEAGFAYGYTISPTI